MIYALKDLNRADFKYIDGILNSWNKDNLKTIRRYREKRIVIRNLSSNETSILQITKS